MDFDSKEIRTILIAPDKFKTTLSAEAVAVAIAKGIQSKSVQTIIHPMADGGEGTCRILTAAAGGSIQFSFVTDPLKRQVKASYGLSVDGTTAWIEMAEASGLWRLQSTERNPGVTTTFGTGELILSAVQKGVREIILGCGGSATHDGAVGMAAALGYVFRKSNGQAFIPTGDTLIEIASIDSTKVSEQLKKVSFHVISDVTNPLTGPKGSAMTFARQKGAEENDLIRLDKGLEHLNQLFLSENFYLNAQIEGAGAGGGFPSGAVYFLNAKTHKGIDWVMAKTGLAEKIEQVDLVITGEGQLDEQSLNGKVVSGILSACLKEKKPCWIVCGRNLLSEGAMVAAGIDKLISISELAGKEESMQRPAYWITQAMHLSGL